MGFYIETSEMKNKAEWLKKNAGAIYLSGRPTEVNPDYVPVCVIDNGQFEAAGIAFDEQEAKSFDDKDDKRKKQWMLIGVDNAVRLCPKVGRHIKW